MGNLTSHQSIQTSDQQRFNKLHIDTHYNLINKALHHHLSLMDSKIGTQKITTDIHKSDVNLAIKYHINAADLKSPTYQRVQQRIYTISNHN